MTRRASWLALLALLAAGTAVPAAHAQWVPPLGIPMPPFGITEVAPPRPSPWTTPVPGYYYVDATHPQATNASNPFGTPAQPRATIPTTLPAGAVVELHGTYDQSHQSPDTLVASGTAASPVFIRGQSASLKPLIRRFWEVRGSYYVLEHLEFGPLDATDTGGLVILAPTTFAALRHSDLHGNLSDGGICVCSFTSATVGNVVIYDNLIHDNGDVNATFDQDVHGIGITQRVNNLWIVDNELYQNSGDGLQINAGTQALQATTHHIYVGRNVSHENKQSGMWSKQAVDVIFSQNTIYGHRAGNSSLGQGTGFQYAPDYVWFLFNHIHDNEFGILFASDSGLGSGTEAFIVGNLIHDIHHVAPGYNPDTGFAPAGIGLWGGTNRYVVNNTIVDVDAGINSPGDSGQVRIVNTIIDQVTVPQAQHVFLEDAGLAAGSALHHTLLGGPVRIKWGGSTVHDLPGFQAAFPGQGTASLAADPGFVDPVGGDFRLRAGSPAIDAGTVDGVYATFLARYGIDIAKDITGLARPQGPAFDLGALEVQVGDGPTVQLSLSRTSVAPGQVLRLDATVGNTGASQAIDVYLVILVPPALQPALGCPGSDGLVFLADAGAVATVGCASADVATFSPFARNALLPGGLSPTLFPGVVQFAWPDGAPAGAYQFVMVLTPAGALADHVVGAGDLQASGFATIQLVL